MTEYTMNQEISPYPLVPKRFASRLRASYQRVESARDRVAITESRILDIVLELRDFESNPVSYSEHYYPSAPDPAAYPTVTRIGRLRDFLAFYVSDLPGYNKNLVLLEEDLKLIEAEIRFKLDKMQSNTKGREVWPKRPRELESFRKQCEADFAKQRKLTAKLRSKQLQKHKEEALRSEVEEREFYRMLAGEIQMTAAKMDPIESIAYTSLMEVLLEKFVGSGSKFSDMHDISTGKSVLMDKILELAEEKARIRLMSEKNE